MRIFSGTSVGKIRDKNEDYYYASQNNLKLFIVADGMGGYNGGEIASHIATNAVKEYIENNIDNTNGEKEKILNMIRSAMEYANSIVYEKSHRSFRACARDD